MAGKVKAMKIIFQFLVVWLTTIECFSQQKIVVAQDGTGNFKTIQEAVNSLPDSAGKDRTIFIKNGIYKEQVYVPKHRIILQGESKNNQ